MSKIRYFLQMTWLRCRDSFVCFFSLYSVIRWTCTGHIFDLFERDLLQPCLGAPPTGPSKSAGQHFFSALVWKSLNEHFIDFFKACH